MVNHDAPKAPMKKYDVDLQDPLVAHTPLTNRTGVQLPVKVRSFVEECVKLCKPDEVYICDGSLSENDQMLKLLERRGTIQPLPKYENW